MPPSGSGANGGRANSAARVPFSGSNYRINNDVNSFIGQLNSTFGTRFANIARIGYTALRDSRSQFIDRPFPLVDIESGGGQTITSFGAEPFTPNNVLDTDIFQFSNDFSAFLGRHTRHAWARRTSSTSFANGFTPNYYGRFRFRSFADFFAHVNAADPTAAGVPQPSPLQPAVLGGRRGAGAARRDLGGAARALRAGRVRAPEEPPRHARPPRRCAGVHERPAGANPTVAALTFRDAEGNPEKIDVSKLPDSKPLWSPRLGVNWDVNGDKSLQVRGGTGVFTGKIPFVWVSNQASNNGVLFGETLVQAASTATNTTFLCLPGTGVTVNGAAVPCQKIVFSDNVTKYVPANPTLPADGAHQRRPRRTSSSRRCGAPTPPSTRSCPSASIGTLEGLYSKDINAVFHRNANLAAPWAASRARTTARASAAPMPRRASTRA